MGDTSLRYQSIRLKFNTSVIAGNFTSVFLFLGTLHPSDEIREINGINVADKSVENLQAILVSDA